MSVLVPEEYCLPDSLEVNYNEQSGRGIYTKQGIAKGSEIFTAQPLGHVAANRCQECLVTKENLLRCSACKKVHYCNRICQRNDWLLHKRECAGLCRIAPNSPTDTMRLVLRLLLKASSSVTTRSQLDVLMSNAEKFTSELKAEMEVQVVGVALLLGMQGEEQDYTSKQIFSMLGKVVSNAFNVMDSRHEEEVGVAVYGLPSLLNHSCDPNTVAMFSGTRLSLRSIKHLSPGEQLTISYYEVLESRERRHAHLSRVYCFTCTCSRCQTEEVQSPTASTAEDHALDKTREQVEREGYLLLDKDLKELEKKRDWASFVRKCSEFMGRAKVPLQATDTIFTKVQEQLMRGQLEVEEWKAALETGEALTTAYKAHLAEYHPVSVLHQVKVAKLRRYIGSTLQLRQALKELAEADEMASTTFGSKSTLSSEVREMMDDIRLELSSEQL